MKEKFLQQTKQEYGLRKRLIALMVEGVFFVGILPLAIIYLSSLLDTRWGLPSLAYGKINMLIGWFLIIIGFLFAGWAIYVQFTIGRGTPAPVMATQKLIAEKPYNYCRNPMTLGTIVFYLGIALTTASIAAIGLVILGAVILLTYIKAVEEEELELRFGDSYRKYREHTPFLIPRFEGKKRAQSNDVNS